MGNFKRNLITGIVYYTLSIWWGYNNSIGHVNSSLNRIPETERNDRKLRKRKLIEGVFKLVLLTSYPIYELIEVFVTKYASFENKLLVLVEICHHLTMISGLIMLSVVEILLSFNVPLPKRVEHFIYWVSCLLSTFALTSDLYVEYSARAEMHHQMLKLTVSSWTVATFGFFLPENEFTELARIILFASQGSWFVQIAYFNVYVMPNWYFANSYDHSMKVLLLLSLALHVLVNAIVLWLIYLLRYFMIKMNICKVALKDSLIDVSRLELDDLNDLNDAESSSTPLINDNQDSR